MYGIFGKTVGEKIAMSTEQVKAEMAVRTSIECEEKIIDFVNMHLQKAGCPDKIRAQIDMAIDEIFSNILQYAYPSNSGGEVRIQILTKKNVSATIFFTDSGIPFNPLDRKDPDISLSVDERQVGGLGIYIVKKTMDVFCYEYKHNQNILKISKYF